MSNETEILKPCPFCKSKTVNDTTPPEAGEIGLYFWVCPDCIAVGPIAVSVEDATNKWNNQYRDAEVNKLREEVERLESQLEQIRINGDC